MGTMVLPAKGCEMHTYEIVVDDTQAFGPGGWQSTLKIGSGGIRWTDYPYPLDRHQAAEILAHFRTRPSTTVSVKTTEETQTR
jgi:hypothetical protein